jgi:hypothetical protein
MKWCRNTGHKRLSISTILVLALGLIATGCDGNAVTPDSSVKPYAALPMPTGVTNGAQASLKTAWAWNNRVGFFASGSAIEPSLYETYWWAETMRISGRHTHLGRAALKTWVPAYATGKTRAGAGAPGVLASLDLGLQLATRFGLTFDKRQTRRVLTRLRAPDGRYRDGYGSTPSWSATLIALKDERLTGERGASSRLLRRAAHLVRHASTTQSEGHLLNDVLPALELLRSYGRSTSHHAVRLLRQVGLEEHTQGVVKVALASELAASHFISAHDALAVRACTLLREQLSGVGGPVDPHNAYSMQLLRCSGAESRPPAYSTAGFYQTSLQALPDRIQETLYGTRAAIWLHQLSHYSALLRRQVQEWNSSVDSLITDGDYAGLPSLLELDRLLDLPAPSVHDFDKRLAKAAARPNAPGSLQILAIGVAQGDRTVVPPDARQLVASGTARPAAPFFLELLARVSVDERQRVSLHRHAARQAVRFSQDRRLWRTPELLALLNWVEPNSTATRHLARLCPNNTSTRPCSMTSRNTVVAGPVEAFVLAHFPYRARPDVLPIAF